MWTWLVLLVGIPAISPPFVEGREAPLNLLEKQLKNWTDTFGNEIFIFGNVATKYDEIQRRFQNSPSSVNPVNMQKVVEEMANETYLSFKEKVDAIRKIMHWAEQKALEHFEKPVEAREKPPKIYYNAKKMNYNFAPDMNPKEIVKAKQDDPLLNQTMVLNIDEHFGAEVNLSLSSVHIPSSVYDRRFDIVDGIHWTSGMDEVFKSNYEKNPTLLWQYFGSSLGFFRQYPATKWPNDNSNRKTIPDMYDCRTRPWYTTAANSPKNIVILQDVSGSMMGLRREISRRVVYTILDTLTENDYVNVLNFTDETHPVVPCFKDSLIQANSETIREFKVSLDQSKTHGMSNFTEALESAYHLLEKHRDPNRADSACCNEAIMLITDGAPETFSEVFDPHNAEMLGRTRVFTYLIGRDVTDFKDMLAIACNNKGYFTHVTTLGEVQEEVLKYLAVMSKPMVMENIHAVTWTSVYADIVETAESDWHWDEKNKKLQSERSQRYKTFLRRVNNETEGQEFYVMGSEDDQTPKGKKKGPRISGRRVAEYLDYGMTNPSELELREMFANDERQTKTHQPRSRTRGIRNFPPSHSHPHPRAEAITAKKQHEIQGARKAEHEAHQENLAKWGPFKKFRFMVSVGLPVFDQRNSTDALMPVTKEQTNNETHTVEEAVKERIAIFLGVVGTDIPIAELQKIATPFKVGVNGYSFALTENGYILFHPDWRPLHADLLKPNYNAVDLAKIELADTDRYHRNLDPKLMEMRKDMLNMETGQEAHVRSVPVRVPLDDFKRVLLRKQKYAYVKIPNTTYTLAIVLPESQQFEFTGELEIRRDGQGRNVTHFFEVPDELRHWRVNPDWTYCEYIRGAKPEFKDNKEGLILHFLREIQQANHSWPWRNTGVGIHGRQTSMDSPIYICDKHLVQSLVFDANVTGVFNLKWYRSYQKEKKPMTQAYIKYNEEIMNPFGPLVGFIATRSGLTRWVNYTDSTSYVPFHLSDIRATEEIWYKRAVDRYEVDRGMSFVITVPYDAGTRQDSYVTATRAIFVHKNGGRGSRGSSTVQSAPVAVAGVQFEHAKMAKRFMEVTSMCDGSGCLKCNSESLNCFVIDDNGYIVISDNYEDTGRFMGEIHGAVMEQLVGNDIYKRVKVVDYQAMCLHLYTRNTFGSALQNPFKYFQWIIKWLIGRMALLALQVNLHSYFAPDFSSVLADAVFAYSDEQELQEDNPNWHPYLELASINKSRLRPCHKEYLLYTYGKKYYSDLFLNGYHPGILGDCDGQGHKGFYGVHLINRTNLIMVAIDGKCSRMRNKIGIHGQEVQYEIDEELENMTAHNDVIAQICRTPYLHLDRKRPSAKCLFYNEEEKDLRRECGGTNGLRSSLTSMLSIGIIVKLYF